MNKGRTPLFTPAAVILAFCLAGSGGGQTRNTRTVKPAHPAAAADKTVAKGAYAGGPEAGRVNRIALHPSDPKIVYAGTSSGGVFRSSNAGDTWTHTSRGITDPQIGGLLVYPPDPKIVLAGTPSGIFRSADEGRSWMHVFKTERELPLPDLPRGVFEMQRTPIRYNAASKAVYAATLDSGLYKSTDGGQHWTQVYGEGLSAPKDRVVLDIEFSPENGGTVYIATLKGLLKSHGSEWTADGAEIVSSKGRKPQSLTPVTIRMAADHKRMYVTASHLDATPLETCVWRRDTPGGPFKLLAQAKSPWVSWSILQCMVVDPTHADRLWAGGVQIHASVDGGQSWTYYDRQDLKCGDSSICGVDYRDLEMDAKGTVLYAAHDQGIFRADVRARKAVAAEKGLVNTQFYDLDVGPNGTLYGGTQDTGAYSRKAGGTWVGFATGGSGDVLGCLADPRDDSRVFIRINAEKIIIVTEFGKKQADSGPVPFPAFYNHTFAYAPASRTIYAGTEYHGMYKSTNDGKTFAPANEGLDKKNIRCVGLVPGSDKMVLAGTVDKELYKTTDGGSHWQKLEGFPGEPPLVIHAEAGGKIFLVGTTGGILASTDGGATWTARNSGLPPRRVVGELSADPKHPDVLFAGLGYFAYEGLYGGGVYESRNGGASWTAMGQEETRTWTVTSVRVDPKDPSRLWVAVYGSGVVSLPLSR